MPKNPHNIVAKMNASNMEFDCWLSVGRNYIKKTITFVSRLISTIRIPLEYHKNKNARYKVFKARILIKIDFYPCKPYIEFNRAFRSKLLG